MTNNISKQHFYSKYVLGCYYTDLYLNLDLSKANFAELNTDKAHN